MKALPFIKSYVRRPTIRASLWTFSGFGAGQLIRLISNLILTRLLFPEAFGLMSLTNVFIVALAMFSDTGARAAIIQSRRGEDPDFLNTAWTVHVLRGFGLWAVACVLAWPASKIYGQPVLFPMLCALGANAAISGFTSMSIATANRRLWLGRLTVARLVGQALAVVVTVILAWFLRSVWALVIGSIVGNVIGVTLGHIALPWHKHAFRIEREALGHLYRFGRWIFLTTLTTYLGGQGIRAIQGTFISVETLGYLSIAGMFAWSMGNLTGRFISTVGFPKLAMTDREDPRRFREVLGRIRLRLLLLTLPVFVALSIGSRLLIDLLYDPRYAVAGQYLAILAIAGGIAIQPMVYVNAFLAKGDSRLNFLLSVTSSSLRIAGTLIGFELGGVLGMLIGTAAGNLLYWMVVSVLAFRAGWMSFRVDLSALAFLFAGAAISWGLVNF